MGKFPGWDKETVLETVVVDEKNKYDIVEAELGDNKFMIYVPYFMSKEGWKKGTSKSLRFDVLEIFVEAYNKHVK
ncbi:ssDNA binding protein [Bacillus phage vB_BceH_LY2]|nr:ssDNA binding protein [Bacillus phage vB_BceH_LY2]